MIKFIKSHVENHVGRHVSDGQRLRSALCEADADGKTIANELATGKQQLAEANSLVAELREELATLAKSNSDVQRLLAKERLKSKRFWMQKCELMLAHEEALEEKDVAIIRSSAEAA